MEYNFYLQLFIVQQPSLTPRDVLFQQFSSQNNFRYYTCFKKINIISHKKGHYSNENGEWKKYILKKDQGFAIFTWIAQQLFSYRSKTMVSPLLTKH